MRITHVIASLDPAMGGPPVVAARLASAQAQLGHDVAIVSYPARQTPDLDPRVRLLTSTPGAWERLTVSSLRPVLAKAAASSDILHLHGVWERLLPVAAKLARRAGVPYVLAPHGMLDPWSLRQHTLKKKLALFLGYRRMLQGAAFLHTLNADEARLLTPLRLNVPTQVIPNGVSLEEIDPLPTPGSFHAQHPEVQGQPFILFLSRLHYKKGLDFLADAFALVAGKNTGVRLVVAGPDEGARADFEQRITAAGLSHRVHLVGPLYGRDKLTALADAACFCLPSRQEGFSLAITEALACRLPAVISDACHFPEVAAAGAGRIVPLDAAALAAALLEVLCDEALRRRMGQAGRALVETRFTWPKIAALTVERYRALPRP